MADEAKVEEQKPEGPQPITLTATFHPDGKLQINCPLMNNPMMMFGFLEVIKDSVRKILEQRQEESMPKIQTGGFLNGIRRFKR